jgi:hypothetical protein
MTTFVTSYFAGSPISGDTSVLTTPSFTPSAGEVIVVKAATWDTGTPSGTPSGGGLVYTRRATAAPGGFNNYATIFTAVVGGSPTSMSVALSAPATSYHTMTVERWSNAQLAASPATNSTINGTSSPPSATITTTAANSAISWVSTDNNSSDPATRAYLSGAIESGLGDGHSGTDGVHYYAYQAVAAAGSHTIGMSAPTNQQWVMVGIEILDLPVSNNATVWLFSA